jgi:hypothetical protein
MALQMLGDLAGATVAYGEAARLQPTLADAHYRLGGVHESEGRPQLALESFQRAARCASDATLREMSEARVRVLEGHEEAAAPLLREIVRRQPNHAGAQGLLAEVLAGMGRFEEATTHFEALLALEPTKVETFYNIVRGRRITTEDSDLLERMDAALRAPGVSDLALSTLHLARGKAFDDLGQYDKAMEAFDAAEEARARAVPFNLERFTKWVESILATFTAEAVNRSYPGASGDRTPVFVLGMPRSGTTLCEQILCSHPDVAGPGELRYWGVRAPTLQRTGPRSLAGTFVADTAAEYIAHLRSLSATAARVVDKNPFNFFWVGLLHLVFPQAAIIHCRRRPIDTAISIHQTGFSRSQRLPTGGEDLVRYYRLYERVMAHWRAVLPPGRMLELDYDTLTASPESETRRIIAYAGLEWNDACLRPEDTTRIVRSASRWQVRQPINTRSVERWRQYAPYLGPLAALIDLPP